jgi:hypothetical protein
MLPHSMVGVIAATIEIPESVTTIGNNVFRGCTSLTMTEIADIVTTIANNRKRKNR